MTIFKICHVFVMTLSTCVVLGQFCDWYYYLGSTDHTMCIYSDKACLNKQLIRSNDLTCEEKRLAVEAHNEYRQYAALGGYERQPQAQNMAEMIWDNELAAIAQRWADQCNFGHDKNRNVGRFSVNQNVAIFTSSNFEDLSADFWSAVKMWYDEVSMFDSEKISPFMFDSNTGHYTQVVWADSFAVGCGFTVFEENGMVNKLYVCNYGPGGNIQGSSMYVTGPRNCLNFPNLSDSPRYPGLCEVVDTFHHTQAVDNYDNTSHN